MTKTSLKKQRIFFLVVLTSFSFLSISFKTKESDYIITIKGAEKPIIKEFVVCENQKQLYSNQDCISLEELEEKEKEVSELIVKIINQERNFRNLRELRKDPVAERIAKEHADYLVEKRQFSHFGQKNKNPDQRYSQINGTGKLNEIINGFFATVNTENQELLKISFSQETAHQLVDAILQTPDKKDLLLDRYARKIGLSLRLSPDQKQLVVVTEIIRDQGILRNLPFKSLPVAEQKIKGSINRNYKFAWIGISKEEFPQEEIFELEAKTYIPPVDQVIYLDMSNRNLKKATILGVTLAAMVAAPFTYGLSIVAANLIQNQVNKIYENHEVEIRKGIDNSLSGEFTGKIALGEYGPGIYYVNLWAYHKKSKKIVLLSTKTVDIR